jgi:RHS repeat-associated protein
LLSRTDPDGPHLASGATIEYRYDEASNRTAVITPNGSVNYAYDERNRLTTVIDADYNITAYQYDDANNLTRTAFANGVVETREYDDLNRLTALENKLGNTVISGYSYELNASGHRVSVTEANGRKVGYTYDNLYHLTGENINSGARTISYTYDNVGNRLTRNDSSEGVSRYSYDDNDRLLSETLTKAGGGIDTTIYSYDANGNMTERVKNGTETTAYRWNDDNRLVRAELPNGDVAEYAYDDEGIRVSSTVNGVRTEYLLDKNQPYAQVLEEFTSDALVAYYVYGHDLISQERGQETSFYQVDGLGSTRVLTDELGVVSDSYDYDAFGNLITSTGGTENSYRYAGEQLDNEQENYYLRDRFYDQSSGRFLKKDSYEGSTVEPLSLHKYIYTQANPTNNVDPSGFIAINIAEITSALKGFTVLQGINFGVNLGFYAADIATGNVAGLATSVVADVGALLLGPGTATGNNVRKGAVVLGKFFSRNKSFKLGVAASGTVLKHNLLEFGFQSIPGGAAHHIIPGTETYHAAQRARDIILSHGIDINSPINGLFLPGRNSPASIVRNGSRHTGRHLHDYYDEVLKRLNFHNASTSKEGAYRALLELRDDLRLGTLKVNN